MRTIFITEKVDTLMVTEAFSQADWIWIHNENRIDEYAEFVFDFDGEAKGVYHFSVTGDSNYNVYLNDAFVGFGQPADYPHYKVYDTFSFANVKKGTNRVRVVVWYYGEDTQTYIKDDAGVIFELTKNGEVIYSSSSETKGRLCANYENYRGKNLTRQLGLGYKYIATAQNKSSFSKCVTRNKGRNFHPRAAEKLELRERVPIDIIRRKDCWIIDMKEETVGFLDLAFECDREATVTVCYGEYLTDGGDVNRYLYGNADFSVEYVAKKGRNEYTNCFRRLAGRFLQVFTDAELKIEYIGLRPTVYPLEAKAAKFHSEIRNRIYRTSVKTLLSCMHEHYEDCPWREQALYNMDARNEMRCTYAAFGDFRFARANLVLMSQGLRSDGLLSICFPAGRDIPIPSFSMIYPVQVYEYIMHSGDKTILNEVFDTLSTIMHTFIGRIDPEKHLIADFPYPYWNFYEWSKGSANDEQIERKPSDPFVKKFDLILNCEFLYALVYYKKLCELYGKTFAFDDSVVRRAVKETFYVQERGLFKASDIGERYYTALGNSYAILCGLADDNAAETLLAATDIVPITLSMNIFLYDALLQKDKKYKDYILQDIDGKYHRMLAEGATTFWETEEGRHAIAHTGSLCHGWAALPIYYYTLLNGKVYFNGTL